MSDRDLDAIFVVPEERINEYLGVSYLQAALARRGMSSKVLQGPPDRVEPVLEELVSGARPPRWVGIACLYVFSAPSVRGIARRVKSRSPATKIVVGGHGATFNWARLLADVPEIDFVIRGEADEALPTLCETPTPLAVPGVAGRDERGAPRAGPDPCPIEALDALPFPARDALRQVIGQRGTEATLVQVMGSRGCYAACRFCSMVAFYSLDGRPMRWRPRSPESVARELAALKSEFGVRHFWFVDDEFIGPPRIGQARLQRMAELLEPLEVEFGFDARSSGVAALSAQDLTRLRGAGLRVVSMGLESGAQAALDRLNKRLSLENNREAIRRLRSCGIEYRYGFIMYDRLTSPRDLHDNLELLRFAEPHRICNAGAHRLLNAEFPEMGSALHRELGLTGDLVGEGMQQNLPNLDERELGYSFEDNRVGQYRCLLRRLACQAVEPAMVGRCLDVPQPGWDVWFGMNKHPQNVAVMGAFLAAHEWLLVRIDELREGIYPDLLDYFQLELSARVPPAPKPDRRGSVPGGA